MRLVLVSGSVLIGILVFIAVLAAVGFDSVVEPFRNFSPPYLGMFLIATVLLYAVYVLRWAAILKYQGIKVPLHLLFRYKLIGSAINYMTPVARMGGEPIKAVLFKNRLGIKGRESVSSIILETSIGASMDVLFIAFMVIFMLLFFTLPSQAASFALMVSLAGLAVVVVYFSTLISRRGPFSFAFKIFYSIIKKPFLKDLVENVLLVEDTMTEFLRSRRRGVAQTIAISAISWPLTFIQYKFALLSIGYDASIAIILLSIIATSVASMVPIPAAFGIQEASHFSVFSFVASANVGIALSLLLRFKDLVTVFLGLTLLSHEGLDLIDVLKQRNKTLAAAKIAK